MGSKMGLFDFMKTNDINAMVAEMDSSTVLVDVREQDEYGSGHVPGAVNYPLSTLDKVALPWDKSSILYVYCLAGTRSSRAVRYLQSQGYSNVMNIGGINGWHGEVEKGNA